MAGVLYVHGGEILWMIISIPFACMAYSTWASFQTAIT